MPVSSGPRFVRDRYAGTCPSATPRKDTPGALVAPLLVFVGRRVSVSVQPKVKAHQPSLNCCLKPAAHISKTSGDGFRF